MSRLPNIVLLVLDGVRSDRMSCYGWSRPTTPFLEQLSGEATVFHGNYSVANQSLPSHVSLFSGVHGTFHGAGTNHSFYDGRFPFITELLRSRGYHTVGVSSHNPYFQRRRGFIRGFNRYTSIVKSSKQAQLLGTSPRWVKQCAAMINHVPGVAAMRKAIRSYRSKDIGMYRALEQFYTRNDHSGRRVIETVKQELAACAAGASPAFLFANIVDAHTPFLPLPRYRDLFQVGDVNDRVLTALFDAHQLEAGRLNLGSDDLETIRRLYDAGIRYVDDLVADLFGALKAMRLLDDTIVIITSDHGEMLLEKEGLLGHGTSLYEGMIRVPLIIRAPGQRHAGSRAGVTSTVDIFSTLAALAGITAHKPGFNYQGSDLLNSAEASQNRFVVSEEPAIAFPERLYAYPEIIRKNLRVERAMMTDDYKYVWSSAGCHRLHRRKEDPQEKDNLYGRQQRERIETMKRQLFGWYQSQLGDGEMFDPEQFSSCGYHEQWLPINPEDSFVRPVDPPETVQMVYDSVK